MSSYEHLDEKTLKSKIDQLVEAFESAIKRIESQEEAAQLLLKTYKTSFRELHSFVEERIIAHNKLTRKQVQRIRRNAQAGNLVA